MIPAACTPDLTFTTLTTAGQLEGLRGDWERLLARSADANTFRAQKVQVGRRGQDVVEIREGLKPGDNVVIEGAFLLKSQLLAESFGEAD